MQNNYDLLKNLNIESLEEEVEAMDVSTLPSSTTAYHEDIDPGIAKQIIGERFIDKPGTRWQLILELDTMTLVAWVPGEEEPTTFKLDSADDVMSYEELHKHLTNPDTVRLDILNTETVPVKFRDWTSISVLSIVLLMIVGFGLLSYVLGL